MGAPIGDTARKPTGFQDVFSMFMDLLASSLRRAAVIINVGFGRFNRMVCGVMEMPLRSVGVMCRFFVVSFLVVFGSLAMVMSSVVVMFSSVPMVLRSLLGHLSSWIVAPLRLWPGGQDWG
jgi:hypothetical protein